MSVYFSCDYYRLRDLPASILRNCSIPLDCGISALRYLESVELKVCIIRLFVLYSINCSCMLLIRVKEDRHRTISHVIIIMIADVFIRIRPYACFDFTALDLTLTN